MSKAPSFRHGTIIGLASLFLGLVASLSYAKGYNPGVQVWGVFHWWVTYEHGLIKRGLIGSLFQWMTHGSNTEEQLRSVVTVHLGASVLLICGLWLTATRMLLTSRGFRDGALVATAWILFFSSQFLPTIGYNTGYLDVYIVVLFGASLIAMAMGQYAIAAILCGSGPFVHENFMFLWLSTGIFFVSLTLCDRRDLIKRGVVLAIPFVSTLIVLAFHSQGAAMAELAAAPIPADMRPVLLDVQFGQTVKSAFAGMMSHYKENPVNFAVSVVYFLLPTVLIGFVAYLRWRDHDRFLVLMAIFCAATIAPLMSLLFAWDLSRFLVLGNLSAIVSFAFVTLRLEKSI